MRWYKLYYRSVIIIDYHFEANFLMYGSLKCFTHFLPFLKVQKRFDHQQKQCDQEDASNFQFKWKAEVVKYVNYLHCQTKIHGNKKNTLPQCLHKDVPLMGSLFIPPSYFHMQKCQVTSNIQSNFTHLKPINIIHPFHYLQLLLQHVHSANLKRFCGRGGPMWGHKMFMEFEARRGHLVVNCSANHVSQQLQRTLLAHTVLSLRIQYSGQNDNIGRCHISKYNEVP